MPTCGGPIPAAYARAKPHPLISRSPAIRFGKPCVTGTRIAVSDILAWRASGTSEAKILADFPQLTAAHVAAAAAFAAAGHDLKW